MIVGVLVGAAVGVRVGTLTMRGGGVAVFSGGAVAVAVAVDVVVGGRTVGVLKMNGVSVGVGVKVFNGVADTPRSDTGVSTGAFD